MKKIIINISDAIYERLRFEAIQQKKDITAIIAARITERPFDAEIEKAFDKLVKDKIEQITKEEK
jgi:hypothetical protein